MKTLLKILSNVAMCLSVSAILISCSSQKSGRTASAFTNFTHSEREIIDLSREKWQWMADKKADTLATLFHEKSMFVHMGGSWGKEQELNVIRSGGIHYKKADIHEVSVKFIDNTAILLNRITLVAVVGGNEVSNPFMATEVYVHGNGKWKLGVLAFSRLAGQ